VHVFEHTGAENYLDAQVLLAQAFGNIEAVDIGLKIDVYYANVDRLSPYFPDEFLVFCRGYYDPALYIVSL